MCAVPYGRRLRSARAERIGYLAAIGAGVAGHVLYEAEDGHVHLAEQVDGAGGVEERQVLRGREDDGAGGLVCLDERHLDVAGAGRKTDDQRVRIAPGAVHELAQRARHHRAAPGERGAGVDELADRQHLHPERVDRHDLLVGELGAVVVAHDARLGRPVDIGVDQSDLPARAGEGDGEVGGQGRFADAALAAADGDDGALDLVGGHGDADIVHVGHADDRGTDLPFQRGADLGGEAGDVEDDAGNAVLYPRRLGPAFAHQIGAARDGHARQCRHQGFRAFAYDLERIGISSPDATVFPLQASYKGFMNRFFGWGARLGAVFNENKGGPWGSGGGSGSGGDGGGPRNPWGQPPRKRRPAGTSGNVTSLDDFLKKSRERFGGGRFPTGDGKPYWLYGLGIFLILWLLFTSIHRIGPEERGVITRFGNYAGTMGPGIGLTFPAPIDSVQKVDVEEIRTIDIGSTDASSENLILTGDQNIIDLAYSVRWNIKEPQLYLFQIANPEETIREVAESAMRAVVAGVSLDDAIGSGRSDIEQRVAQVMQQLLDDYRAGIDVQGVAIKQSDPPAAVNAAFKEVSAAQQQADRKRVV